MKNRKFLLFTILILSIVIFSTGCMRKVNEKIAGKVIEKSLEKALGEDVKIDAKDKSFSISTGEGDLQLGENLDWPSNKMSPLPKPKATVVSIVDQANEKVLAVTVNFSSQKEASKYLDQIKDLGYIEISTSESNGFFGFVGYARDNSMVSFNTFQSDEFTAGVITLSKDRDEVRDYFTREEDREYEYEDEVDFTNLDLTDDVEWPEDKMGILPRLEGKVTGVTNIEGTILIEIEYVKKEDLVAYIAAVKKLGFDENTTESTMSNSIFYIGSNSEGDYISISWDNSNTGIMYAKSN